ncbi:MAG: hypothetical protein JO265_07185, partial [Acidimicrobiia bacterium]|nr:hypothetical protein [Acidimicrobiia bacterium]
YQLFEAAVELISAVATDRPVLLMLDDLHWSDKPTLLLAREMTRRLADAPVLLLGTYRDTDLNRTHPLAELLADLRKEKAVLRLALSGLPPAALERLLAGDATLGAWEKGLARELSRETEGNPLFVREILRHLVETGAIAEEDGRWVPRLELERLGIPEGVKEVIGRRLSRLSDAANRVLRVGAVAGREFDFRLLETVTDVSGDELLDAVDEALATRLLIDVLGRPDRYAFSHALVRETLYDELSTARRLRLHRQIGLALEELSGPDVSARLPELAYHFCEAAPAGEAAKAVDYARQGGDRAMAQLGYEEAVRLYGMALEACEELEGADAVRCELTLALGEARWRAGGIDAARPTFAAAAQMARPLGDPVLLARAALGFAGAGVQFWWIEVGRFNQAVVALLEEALQRLPSEDSEWRARCTSCLAQELYFEPGTRERRRQLVDDAVAMARRLGDRPTLAYVLSSSHLAVFSPDVEGDPLHYGEELLELADELGDRELAFHAHAHRMTMFTTHADLGAARRELKAAADLAEQLRRPAHQFLVLGVKGMMAQLEGRWEDAEAFAYDVFRLGQELGDPNAFLIFSGQVSVMALIRGRFGGHAPAELVGTANDAAEAFPLLRAWRAMIAVLCTLVDADDDARRELDDLAPDDFEGVERDLLWLVAMFLASEVCVQLGDVERAAVLYDLLQPYESLLPLMGGALGCMPPVAVSLGSLATLLGRWDEAEAHLAEADAIVARLDVAYMRVWAQMVRVQMLQARRGPGDLDAAEQLLA